MREVIVTKSINVSAQEAWGKLSSFRGIEDYSPIERSETNGQGAGATRTCYLPDGAAIHELLKEVENEKMEMQYVITEGPFPVTAYKSNIKVEKSGEGQCKITWGCEFESEAKVEDEMANLFGGFYHAIIDGLEKLVNNQD